MKRPPPKDRLLLSLFALGIITAFATGGYISQQWVSPCVCVYAQAAARIN